MSGNRQLGEFLRSRRLRLDPAVLGLPTTRRRRTSGLRREEVADRAGISCEWYVKLEQGRDVQASSTTLDALVRALVLNTTEAAHLHRMAARAPASGFVRETVPDTLTMIVEGLPDPAYITGERWDVLAWNGAADDLFGFGAMAIEDLNILLYMITHVSARSLFGASWAMEARRMVALFRTVHDQRVGDPAFEALLSRLSTASTEFRTWWSLHDVETPSAGSKTLLAPNRESMSYRYATFQANDDPVLKLALYTRGTAPVGKDAA